MASDHVTSTYDDVWLPVWQEGDASGDFSAVVGRAVFAVEIADDGKADVTARGSEEGGRADGGAGWILAIHCAGTSQMATLSHRRH